MHILIIYSDSLTLLHNLSSSILYSSGSNIFGDAAADTHRFVGNITASGNISSSGALSTFGEVVHLEGTDPRLKLKAKGANHPGIEWHEDASRKWILYSDPDTSQAGNDNLTWKNASNTELMELDQDGLLYVSSKIVHLDDPDTFIDFTADDINIKVGNVNMVDFTQNDSADDEITFNEAGADLDFRIESDDDTKAFYIDADKNAIQLGTAAGTHVTASGNISSSGTITANAFVGDGSGLSGISGGGGSGIFTLTGSTYAVTDTVAITGSLFASQLTASGAISTSCGSTSSFGRINMCGALQLGSEGIIRDVGGSGVINVTTGTTGTVAVLSTRGVTIGGGFGSTGTSITATGIIQTDGQVDVGAAYNEDLAADAMGISMMPNRGIATNAPITASHAHRPIQLVGGYISGSGTFVAQAVEEGRDVKGKEVKGEDGGVLVDEVTSEDGTTHTTDVKVGDWIVETTSTERMRIESTGEIKFGGADAILPLNKIGTRADSATDYATDGGVF